MPKFHGFSERKRQTRMTLPFQMHSKTNLHLALRLLSTAPSHLDWSRSNHLQLTLWLVKLATPLNGLHSLRLDPRYQLLTRRNIVDQTDDLASGPYAKILVAVDEDLTSSFP